MVTRTVLQTTDFGGNDDCFHLSCLPNLALSRGVGRGAVAAVSEVPDDVARSGGRWRAERARRPVWRWRRARPRGLRRRRPPRRFESICPGVAAGRFASRRYGFNCGYCSSRLEATGAMAAQEGQCPTCGNQITIPILDRYGRLIDPKTRQIIKQDPHPVHAYAAAGERAPR